MGVKKREYVRDKGISMQQQDGKGEHKITKKSFVRG